MLTTSRDIKGALPALALALILVSAIFAAGPVSAEDVDLTVSQRALQEFFTAATPFSVDFTPVPGQAAARITMKNPKILLSPGKPGVVRIEFDYEGESPLLGLPPFSGHTKPEAVFTFTPAKSALAVTFKDFVVNAGRMKIRLDRMLKPQYLPLVPDKPVDLETHKIKVDVKNARTEVTKSGLRVLADYKFTKLAAPKPAAQQTGQ